MMEFKPKMILIRVPVPLLKILNETMKKHYGVSRTKYIVDAIEEKIKRESK